MASQFLLKVGWEALLTPMTYAVVGWLKRREGVDVYDQSTDFHPVSRQVLRGGRGGSAARKSRKSHLYACAQAGARETGPQARGGVSGDRSTGKVQQIKEPSRGPAPTAQG